MKKSSILTKLLLALVMVALVLSLVACGGNTDDTKKPGKDDPKEEKSFVEQVVDIMKGVSPIINTLNGVKADGTLGAEVSLKVDYNIGQTQGAHEAAVKATANATNPAAQISYKNGKTSASDEWFNLTYKDNKLYLVQPVTAVNTAAKTDATVSDLTALNPAVLDIMAIAMDALEGLNIELDMDAMADSLEGMLSEMGDLDLSSIIEITSSTSGYTLEVGEAGMAFVGQLVPGIVSNMLTNYVGAEIAGKVETFLKDFLAKNPTLSVKVGLDNGAINGLSIGYTEGENSAGIDIGLKVSNQAANIVAPQATNKALNIGAAIEAAQKQAKVALEAYGALDLNADGNPLAYANLAATLKGQTQNSYGYFDGTAVYFNTNALSVVSAGQNNTYKATIQIDNEEGVPTAKSIVAILNDTAKDIKADYFAAKNAQVANADAIAKSFTQNIYSWLGGTLELNDAKDAYVEVTEAQMMGQLRTNIADYTRFEIDDTYIGTVKNIVALFGANDTWMIGGDLVKSDLSAITKWSDFVTFANWVNTDAKCDGGIFNWDKTNYNGGVILVKEGANNDLLDAVNVFAATGKTEAGEYVDVDAAFIADFVNYYIAALGYYTGAYTEAEIAAIDAIDMQLAYAKCQYQNAMIAATTQEAEKAAKEEWSQAKKNHKEALKNYYTNEKANEIVTKLIGVNGGVKALINGGLYINIGAEKDKGINGYIEIRNALDGENVLSYVKVSAHIGLVDNTIAADVAKAGINTAEAKELYAPETVTAETENADDYRILTYVMGSNVPQVDPVLDKETGATVGYEYVYATDGEGNYFYSDKYENGEELIEILKQAAVDYMNA